MVTITIEVELRDVQMGLAYAETELAQRVREFDGRDVGPESRRYLESLRSAFKVIHELHERSYSAVDGRRWSLTPQGDDALDRELRRRDEIAKGGA